jgi:hypothetical protein
LTLTAVLAVAHVSAGAHHSPSRFDQGRELTLTGVVARVEWTNPHVSLHVTVEHSGGETAVWAIEAQSPRVMTLFGWTPRSLARGDRVRIAAHPSRDGNTLTALGRAVTTKSGAVLHIPWQPEEIRAALRAESRDRR